MFHVDIYFISQLQEYKSKMQESNADLQRQLQAAKKVTIMIYLFYKHYFKFQVIPETEISVCPFQM